MNNRICYWRLQQILLVITLIPLLWGCKKDGDEEQSLAVGCSLPTGSLKWTADGASQCANVSLFADHALIMTVNGITVTGATMTMELDSVQPGTYAVKELTNSMIYTDQLGMAFLSTDTAPGTVTITKNDTVANWLEATFTVSLKNPLGVSKTITEGMLQVDYTE